MSDRGMIKWMPFDSVYSGKKMVQNIMVQKEKRNKPILSQEQLLELEQSVWEAFHNQIPLCITYFFQGQFQTKNNVCILDIQVAQKKILLEDHSILYFDQILHVHF